MKAFHLWSFWAAILCPVTTQNCGNLRMKLSKLRNRKKEIRAKENVKLKKCFCRLYPKLVENIINCNLGQNKMEQKTPLTLAAQPPPPPPPLQNQGLKPRERRNTLYIYIIPNPWFFYVVGGGAEGGCKFPVHFVRVCRSVSLLGYEFQKWLGIDAWVVHAHWCCVQISPTIYSQDAIPRCYWRLQDANNHWILKNRSESLFTLVYLCFFYGHLEFTLDKQPFTVQRAIR